MRRIVTARRSRSLNQSLVRTPIEEAFSFAADFANIERWASGVTASRRIDGGPLGASTDYDPPSRVVLEGTGAKVEAVDEMLFTVTDAGTRIDYRAHLTFKGSQQFVAPLNQSRLVSIGRDAVAGLRDTLTP